KNLGVFSRVNVPIGFGEIQKKLESVRAAVIQEAGVSSPALHLLSGSRSGQTFLLKKDHIAIGRADPANPSRTSETDIVLPEEYAMVTRITKPHAILSCSAGVWQVEDVAAPGGRTSTRNFPLPSTGLSSGTGISSTVRSGRARLGSCSSQGIDEI